MKIVDMMNKNEKLCTVYAERFGADPKWLLNKSRFFWCCSEAFMREMV